MTQAELLSVNTGGTVVVTVAVTDLHQHDITITKWF
jgi:hypothetical protein